MNILIKNIKVLQKQIVLLIFGFGLTSCISFPKEIASSDKQELDSDLSSFEGIYEIKSYNYHPITVIVDLLYRGEKNRPQTSLNNNYVIQIEAIKSDSLKFTLLHTDSIIKRRTIKVKKLKDNTAYLRNRNVIRHNIPFILGGIDINKHRISLSNDGDLIIENAQFEIKR